MGPGNRYFQGDARNPKSTSTCNGKPFASTNNQFKIGQVSTVEFSNIDKVPSNAHHSEKRSQLFIFEDNEAVIKMIIKGRSPTMRHVSRTHRVALFDRINLDRKIQIGYVESNNQLADIVAKGSFTRDEWNHLLHLFNIMNNTTFTSHFFVQNLKHSVAMSKRSQESFVKDI